MQTSKSDRFTSERQTMKMECQNRETKGLDGKHLIRQAIIEPTQDRYDGQRSEKCDCNKMPIDLNLSEYFQGQGKVDTGKVGGYYYNTQAKVTFENPLSTQISEDEMSIKSENIRLDTSTTLE